MSKQNNELYNPNFLKDATKKSDNFLQNRKHVTIIEDKLFSYVNGVKSLVKEDIADDLDIVLMLRFIRNASPQEIQNTVARFKVSSMDDRVAFLGFNAHEKDPLTLKRKFMKTVLNRIGIKNKTLIDYMAVELNHEEYKDHPEINLVNMIKSLKPKKRALLEKKLGAPLAAKSMADYLDNPKIQKSMVDYIAKREDATDLSRLFDQALTIAPFLPASLVELSNQYEALFVKGEKTHDSEVEQMLENVWNEFTAVFNSKFFYQLNRTLNNDSEYSSHDKNQILANKLTPLSASFIIQNEAYKTMMKKAFTSFYSCFVFQVSSSIMLKISVEDFAEKNNRFLKIVNNFMEKKLLPKAAVIESQESTPTLLDSFRAFMSNIWETISGWFSSDPTKTSVAEMYDIQAADSAKIRTPSSDQFKHTPAPEPSTSPKGKEEADFGYEDALTHGL